MKIEVGMYVRNKIYGIAKIKSVWSKTIEIDKNNCYGMNGVTISRDSIIGEPSFNIIDLIEVGDILHSKYDNEWWTVQKHQGPKEPLWIQLEWQVIESEKDFFEQIDGIIAKEQAESVSYKIS